METHRLDDDLMTISILELILSTEMLVVLLSDVVSSHCKSPILFLEFYDTFTSLF